MTPTTTAAPERTVLEPGAPDTIDASVSVPPALEPVAEAMRAATARVRARQRELRDALAAAKKADAFDRAGAAASPDDPPAPTRPACEAAVADAQRKLDAARGALRTARLEQDAALAEHAGQWRADLSARVAERVREAATLLDELERALDDLNRERTVARALDEFAAGKGWRLRVRASQHAGQWSDLTGEPTVPVDDVVRLVAAVRAAVTRG